MIGQVQMINGVKTIVPVTDTTPVDEVTVDNMQSVSSNAVATTLQGYATTSALSQAIKGTLKDRNYLSNANNLNSVNDGYYYYQDGNTPQNGYGSNGFVIQVRGRDNLIFQICYEWNNAQLVARHTDFYGNWGSWTVLHSF